MLDLTETLKLHSLWLQGDPAGVRADLRFANLRGANLSDVNLGGANLSDTEGLRLNLRGANLINTNLSYADLRGANLINTNLSYANLRYADLSGANLSYANLRYADLRGANLWCANLRGAEGLPIVEDAPARLQAVAATVLAQPAALQMGAWHGDCGTDHSLAGWAIHQAGPLGAVLEQLHGSHFAGLVLLGASAAQHFYDSNEAALEWLRSIHATTTEQDTTQ